LSAIGGTNQIGLSWNASVGATGYNLKRATITGGPYANVAGLAGTNHADAGFAAGTTYFYVVEAQARWRPECPADEGDGDRAGFGWSWRFSPLHVGRHTT